MKIRTWIKYEESYLPPRCRKLRYKECEEHVDINLREIRIEENYEYRMENIMQKFVKDYELEGLSAEELQDKIWSEYAEEFAHAVLQDMNDFSGDELFEIGE